MIKPFTLNNLLDEDKIVVRDAEFMILFDKDLTAKEATATGETAKQVSSDEAVDIESITRKAFEDAYVQGEKAGHEMGMKKVEPLIKRLSGDISALAAFKEDLVKKAEKLAVELSIAFTEAIVLKECEEKRNIIINMVKKALEICEEKSEIRIRMRRDDAKHIPEESVYPLKIVPDDTLKDPGFIIETNFGDIDGTIATQIEEIKKAFINEYAD